MIVWQAQSLSTIIIFKNKKDQRFAKLQISKFKNKTFRKKFSTWMIRRMSKMFCILQGKDEIEWIENISWGSNLCKVLQAAISQSDKLRIL